LYFSLYFCNFAALFYLTTENKDPYNEKDIYSNGFCALNDDAELKAEFTPIAKAMNENEAQIVKELTEVQGKPANTGGYYLFDDELTSKVMRPSATLNKIIG
jgi:monomeric isocitrate dehydrogenase